MTKQTPPASVDAYLAQLPPETREVLAELRALIRARGRGAARSSL